MIYLRRQNGVPAETSVDVLASTKKTKTKKRKTKEKSAFNWSLQHSCTAASVWKQLEKEERLVGKRGAVSLRAILLL